MDGTDAEVFVGVDMAKEEHYAQAITPGGVELFDRPVLNDESVIEVMLDDAGEHGSVAVVIDMTASGAQLLLAVALWVPKLIRVLWPGVSRDTGWERQRWRAPDIRSTDIRRADFEARRVVRQPQVSLVAGQTQRSARMGSIACGVAVVVYVYGAFEDDYDIAGSE